MGDAMAVAAAQQHSLDTLPADNVRPHCSSRQLFGMRVNRRVRRRRCQSFHCKDAIMGWLALQQGTRANVGEPTVSSCPVHKLWRDRYYVHRGKKKSPHYTSIANIGSSCCPMRGDPVGDFAAAGSGDSGGAVEPRVTPGMFGRFVGGVLASG